MFSPDGKLLASTGYNQKVRIWDATTWSLQQTFHNDSAIFSLAFSCDSKIIALGTSNTIKIWDTETRNDPERVSGSHDDLVSSVVFSHDLKLLASTSRDRTIKVWDLAKMTVIRTLRGHGKGVSSAAFSPDSKLIVSASQYGTMKIWDTQTGNLQQTVEGLGLMRGNVTFSRDGRLLAACNNYTIRIWEIATLDLTKLIEIEYDKMIRRGLFDETGMFLDTNKGRFKISDGSRVPEVDHLPPRQYFQREIGWGLNDHEGWITWNNENILRLPPDYRPSLEVAEVIESPAVTMIAIGTFSGRVSVIELLSSGPLDWM